MDCKGEVEYVAEYVADYYPFGKILREWIACDQERYLTTYHERDKESGYFAVFKKTSEVIVLTVRNDAEDSDDVLNDVK